VLTSLADGVWIDSDPVHIVGTRLTATMTVLTLGDGSLLLYSPVSLSEERRAAIGKLGRVAHLYAPNAFHHSWLGDWARAFPEARVHAAGGAAKKRRELRIDRVLAGQPDPALASDVDELHIDGFRLDETVLVHRSSRTLLVADLLHNVGRPEGGWTKLYTQMMGFYGRVALSKALQLTAFSDRAAARRSVDSLLGLSFERAVVGHGAPVTEGVKDAIARAYAWLGA
jgi:hypothetical protein